jgi:ribosomal protein S27E
MMRLGALLTSAASGNPAISDGAISVTCGDCATTQTLAQADPQESGSDTSYRCNRCGTEIAGLSPDGYGMGLRAPFGFTVAPPAG